MAQVKKNGRPASPHRERYPLRHDPEDRIMFDAAAATCGMALSEWILRTLRAEARKATHVPMLKRAGRRGE
jgi:uncharacterized protein (DUF1778 family)